jgi:hypothetical protein
MANPIPMDTRLNEPQAQSTGFRNPVEDGQLNSRRGLTAFDIEAGGPIISSENEALDLERQSYELKRRQVQMMAFGMNPFFRLITTQEHPWEQEYCTVQEVNYTCQARFHPSSDISLWVPSNTQWW